MNCDAVDMLDRTLLASQHRISPSIFAHKLSGSGGRRETAINHVAIR
jgi:hypothetical protein